MIRKFPAPPPVRASQRRFFLQNVKRARQGLVAVAILAMSSMAIAQVESEASRLFDDDDYLGFEAVFGLEFRQEDNIFTTDTQAIDSVINAEMVELKYALEPSDHRIEFEYAGEFAQYQNSGDDDYADHNLSANADLSLGTRTGLSLSGDYERGHQARGSGLSAGLSPASPDFPPEPDEYDLSSLSGMLIFGRQESIGQIELEAGIRDLEFQNNLDRTQFFSRQFQYAGGTFYYRYLPKTSFLIDARFTGIEYDDVRPMGVSIDSDEIRSRVGIQWDATARTTGFVKIGYLSKDFDADERDDFSGLSWEIDVTWSPRTYSHFGLQSAREARDATDLETDYIDSEWVALDWTHEWSWNWLTVVGVGFSNDDYIGTARTEDLTWLSLEIDFRTSQRLVWYVGAQVSSQDSSLDRFAYDDDIYRLGVRFQLF